MTEMPTWLLGTAADGIPTLPDSLPLPPGDAPKRKQKKEIHENRFRKHFVHLQQQKTENHASKQERRYTILHPRQAVSQPLSPLFY